MLKDENKIYIFAIVIAVVINLFSWHFPFFWDTILTSTITQHFFVNGFQNFITPAQFDAGHPPLFYVYITTFYFIFGKSLFSAHFAILPFIIIGIVSFIQLLQYFKFTKQQQYLGLILFFSIPAVLTQYCLVSYDAVLLSLYLLALNLILNNKKILFAFVLMCIVGISLRGLFCLVSLSITIYFLENRNVKSWFKWNLFFIPSVIIIAIWFGYHYQQTGWFISTNAEGWSQQRSFVNAFGLFKNSISIARIFFDLGIVIISLWSLFYIFQKKKIDIISILWLVPMLCFSISFLPFSNPINHRYFLIVFVLMLFPAIQFLSTKKNIYSVFTVVFLLLGHLFIYPVPISNGWDCTLAHTSYFRARTDFFKFNERDLKIDKTKIGTVFPMNTSLHQTNMELDSTKMINVNGKSIDSVQYVLFSNIGNDFSDDQIIQLKNWHIKYEKQNGLVKLILYENPKNDKIF